MPFALCGAVLVWGSAYLLAGCARHRDREGSQSCTQAARAFPPEPSLTSGSLSEGQNRPVGWKGALFKLGTMIVGKDGEAFLAKWTGDDAPLVTFKQGGFFSSCKWILTSYRVLRKKKVNSTIMALFGGLYQVFLFCMYGFFSLLKNYKKDICFS